MSNRVTDNELQEETLFKVLKSLGEPPNLKKMATSLLYKKMKNH